MLAHRVLCYYRLNSDYKRKARRLDWTPPHWALLSWDTSASLWLFAKSTKRPSLVFRQAEKLLPTRQKIINAHKKTLIFLHLKALNITKCCIYTPSTITYINVYHYLHPLGRWMLTKKKAEFQFAWRLIESFRHHETVGHPIFRHSTYWQMWHPTASCKQVPLLWQQQAGHYENYESNQVTTNHQINSALEEELMKIQTFFALCRSVVEKSMRIADPFFCDTFVCNSLLWDFEGIDSNFASSSRQHTLVHLPRWGRNTVNDAYEEP